MDDPDLPHDITAKIFGLCNLNNIIGIDDAHDLFIIHQCYMIHHEVLLQILVKKRRFVTLVILFRKYDVKLFSYTSLTDAIQLALKQNDINIAAFICRKASKYIEILQKINCRVVRSCMLCILRQNNEIVFNNLITFMTFFVGILYKHEIKSSDLQIHMIPRILTHKFNDKIVSTILEQNMIDNICLQIASDTEVEVTSGIIRLIIEKNQVNLLSRLVDTGYIIQTCDIILGIACSNMEMNTFLLQFFKPRCYTVEFARHLFNIAKLRQEQELHDSLMKIVKIQKDL